MDSEMKHFIEVTRSRILFVRLMTMIANMHYNIEKPDLLQLKFLSINLLQGSVHVLLPGMNAMHGACIPQEYELAFTHGYNRYLIFSGHDSHSLQEVFSQISTKEEAALVVSVCVHV